MAEENYKEDKMKTTVEGTGRIQSVCVECERLKKENEDLKLEITYSKNLLGQIYNLFPSCYEAALVALKLPQKVRERWEKWSKL